MSRVLNFGAGPAALPLPVLEQAQAELLDWQGRGYSIMELGHRTPMFAEIVEQSMIDLRELLSIPDNYKILFLGGGARVQFSLLPMNLLGDKKSIDIIESGFWSNLAAKEASRYAQVNLAGSSAAADFKRVPRDEDITINPDAAYCYYTGNETIEGVEFHHLPAHGDVPLVCDMTSNFLAYPLDVSQFGVIFAGAQKNAGIAGLTIVIVREDLLARAPMALTPSVYDYRLQAEKNSLLITPPTFPWYMTSLVLSWLKSIGGVAKMGEINLRKAKMLYDVIDHYDIYHNPVASDSRSRMNVVFRLPSAALEERFLSEATSKRLCFLKGHIVKGGIRASIYNAISEQEVATLSEFMVDFAKRGA